MSEETGETNPHLIRNMFRLAVQCIEKFEERQDKHNPDITNHGVSPTDVGWEKILDHMKEEYEELLDAIESGDYDRIMSESRDATCMFLMVNWYAKEKKIENNISEPPNPTMLKGEENGE